MNSCDWLDQVTGIGSRSTFWRPIGGRRAELFALGFVRALGASPVAASIKTPRMRSYQTACSVLLGAREFIHVWRRVKAVTEPQTILSHIKWTRHGHISLPKTSTELLVGDEL